MSAQPHDPESADSVPESRSPRHHVDEVTGLPNRRLLHFMLERQFAAARRGAALSVVLFEVGGLPEYGERHGAEAVDLLVRRLAAALERTTRLMDVCGRFGDSRFLVLIPGEACESGEIVAGRVRQALIHELAGETGPLAVTAGVAGYEEGMMVADDLIARAEEVLREAAGPGAEPVQVAMSLAQAAASLVRAGRVGAAAAGGESTTAKGEAREP